MILGDFIIDFWGKCVHSPICFSTSTHSSSTSCWVHFEKKSRLSDLRFDDLCIGSLPIFLEVSGYLSSDAPLVNIFGLNIWGFVYNKCSTGLPCVGSIPSTCCRCLVHDLCCCRVRASERWLHNPSF